MADERPQEHWLNAIAEYTVHAPNCPFYEDGNCECAVEEFRATLRRVLVPSRLRAASNEQGKDVVVIGLERILEAVDVPDTLLSGTRSVLRRAIARLSAGTGEAPRFKRTVVCAACAMEDDEPLVCDSPGCDGQPRFVTGGEETERYGWALEHGVTCVVCPDCAFTFDADHTDEPGGDGYSCPSCGHGLPSAFRATLRAPSEGTREPGEEGVGIPLPGETMWDAGYAQCMHDFEIPGPDGSIPESRLPAPPIQGEEKP